MTISRLLISRIGRLSLPSTTFCLTLEDFYSVPYEWISSQLGLMGVESSVTYGSTNFLSRDYGVVNLWSCEVGVVSCLGGR